MNGLTKTGHRLLRTVKNKPHATQDDHYDAPPTPPATSSTRSSTSQNSVKKEEEEDINRDPVSSDEEKPIGDQRSNFVPPQGDGAADEVPKAPKARSQHSASHENTTSRRSNGMDNRSSDSENAVFGSQAPRKRQKRGPFNNVHAQKIAATYTVRNKLRKTSKTSGFNQPRATESKSLRAAAGPQFKAPKGGDMFEFGTPESPPNFQPSKTPDDVSMVDPTDEQGFYSLSSPLSSLSSPPSSPEVEEIKDLDLPAPQAYVQKTECTICGQDIELFLKQDFEDEFTRGKQMNYRWQQRFCRYHKQHEAKQVWQRGGYPEIEWDGLERRMRRHHSHLKDVMGGGKASYHREQLSERLKSRSKTAMQTLNETGPKRGASVGYYGPRGEKIM